jgi:acyl-coenzyme A thioesterase PaaI-like protein
MITEIANPFPDHVCFFCGCDNKEGLHLRFFRDSGTGEVFTDYLPEQRLAGQGTILHGGIQAGILDEIMGWTGYAETGSLSLTTKLEISYFSPVYIAGKPVRVSCRIAGDDGKKLSLEATITDADGTLCTSATGRFHKVSPEKYDALVRRDHC